MQIKINVADEEQVVRGNVFCHRDSMMPVTQMFIAEIDVLQLLEYKPIISKGYTCIMHIHTYNDEVVILLSPAAASFDQFESYEARGDTFRLLIKDKILNNPDLRGCLS